MWSFNKHGLKPAVIEFFVSALKTLAAALVAFALLRLNNVHIDPASSNAELLTGAIVLGRALLSAFLKWVNTLGPAAESAAVAS